MSDTPNPANATDPADGPTGPVDAGAPQGVAIPLPPAGSHPLTPYQGQASPIDPTPAGGVSPTPPQGTWPTPPQGTWPTPPQGTWPTPPQGTWPASGAVPPGTGWVGGATPPPPPYGWTPPGYAAPAPQPPTPKKRTGLVVGLAAIVVAVAIVAGAGLGHVVWSSNSPTTAAATAPSGSGSSGSSGGTTTPSGNGSSGGSFSPFGGSSSGSSGSSSSTGAGAPSDISAIAAKVDPGLVDINTNLSYEDEQAAGTGMVLTSTGEVLTNNHVIDGATSISVTDIGNGKTYSAKVVGYDRTGDVAVVQLVDASGLTTVSTSTAKAALGEAVVGIGNAGGTGGTPSTAGGSVTALGQSITASDDGGGNSESLSGLIETDAGIEPGDSGGSLVNAAGKVIGMDTAASSGSEYGGATQAYAIPISTALSIAKKIEAGDSTTAIHIGATGFLGVSVAASSSSSSSSSSPFGGGYSIGGGSSSSGTGGSGSTATGADVEGTLSGSPAAAAGLVEGDVITAVNGTTISSSTDLSNALTTYHPGKTIQLTWINTSGQSQTASITLESGPPA